MQNLVLRSNTLIKGIVNLEDGQRATMRQKEQLLKEIDQFEMDKQIKAKDLDIILNAVTILREVSDNSVKQSYKFITDNINIALSRVFENSVRSIELVESTRSGQYPQLDVVLKVEGGIKRSMALSGHGIAQIVSILIVLCLVALTGSRRFIAMDEVLSGLSAESRMAMSDVLEAFKAIGFQFIMCEHGFAPRSSHVYEMKMEAGVSNVCKHYITEEGIYINGDNYKEQF